MTNTDETFDKCYSERFPHIMECWDNLWKYVSYRAYGSGRKKQDEPRELEWSTTALRLNKIGQKMRYLMDCEMAGGAKNLQYPGSAPREPKLSPPVWESDGTQEGMITSMRKLLEWMLYYHVPYVDPHDDESWMVDAMLKGLSPESEPNVTCPECKAPLAARWLTQWDFTKAGS